MEYKMDSEWALHPIGGDTGQAYMGVKEHERVFLKRNSTPLLAALSGEGITPRLIWSKRTPHGDVITAQEWLEGRVLTAEEMMEPEVAALLRQVHQSTNLLQMMQRIQGKEYNPEQFIEDYLTHLQFDLQSNQFLSTIVRYLQQTSELIMETGKTVCHGDLNRRNFMLSDDGELYLVDWESVRLADPISDLTMLLVQYVPVSRWTEWLDMYGAHVSTTMYQRMEWYSLMNCLFLIKKAHFDGRFYDMNKTILLAKTIYNHRLQRRDDKE